MTASPIIFSAVVFFFAFKQAINNSNRRDETKPIRYSDPLII